jgi:segregation and condensation protein A
MSLQAPAAALQVPALTLRAPALSLKIGANCTPNSQRRRLARKTSLGNASRHPLASPPQRMSQEYKVKLEIFEGPLDLLLYLVKKDEVDIYEISLERITQQYLQFIEAFKMLDLEIAGEFLVMASNLLYLKSRSLLPVDQQPPDEEAEEDDPRWELIRQLVEYKKFKEAAAALGQREALQSSVFARMAESTEPPAERPLGEVSIFDLINAFSNVLKRIASKSEDLREIFAENFSVSDKIDLIMKMIGSGVPLKFTELFSGAASRSEIVVTFLALLELVRLKQVRCVQEGPFGDIELRRV